MLKTANLDLMKIAVVSQQKTPIGAQLPKEIETKVCQAQSLEMLFQILGCSDYWSWIDIRILHTIVIASENAKALMQLENYKKSIFSRKLINILHSVPSKQIKHKYFTKLGAKLNKNANKILVSDLLEIQSQLEMVIMNIAVGSCILSHIKKGCIEVYWFIPTHCVDSAYQSASTRCHMFNEVHVLWLEIHSYPVIHNPLSLSPIITLRPPDCAGKLF